MPNPAPKQIVFVAWDHSVPDYEIDIKAIGDGRSKLHNTYSIRLCDANDPQGSIGPGVLEDIDRSDCLLAFLERPNCHVLFEAGYALGKGKKVFLRVYSAQTKDRWIEQVRWLRALPINPLPREPSPPRIALEKFDDAISQRPWQRAASATSVTRTGTVVHCPTASPGRTIREALQDPEGSTLHDKLNWPHGNASCEALLDSLDRVDRLVWVMPGLTLPDDRHLPVLPDGSRSRYRDHPENAAYSLLAGYAFARQVSLVFCPQQSVMLRPLLGLDLEGVERIDWCDRAELIKLLSDCLRT